MAGDRERFLLIAGNLVFLCQVLGCFTHSHIGPLVGLKELWVRHRVEAAERHPGHAFDAGADERFAGVELNGACGHVDGLHG